MSIEIGIHIKLLIVEENCFLGGLGCLVRGLVFWPRDIGLEILDFGSSLTIIFSGSLPYRLAAIDSDLQ